MLRGKFTAWNVHVKKEERSNISNLIFHFRKLQKEEQFKHKGSRIKEIIKIGAEISGTENSENSKNSIENQWNQKLILWKISKSDKTLTSQTKRKKKEKKKITNIRNERRAITTDPMDYRIIKEYYEQCYAHKFDNLDEMDQFLKRYKLPNSHKEK